ncbi:MAG: hypothetical protein HFE52_02130 [Clostridia bacterium]|nr:hypothetical protein [Clostridia bacterium]
MKKYYIIFGTIGALFVLMLATLIANHNMIYLIRPRLAASAKGPTVLSDTLLIIVGIVVIIAIISVIVYKIYKAIQKIRNKKDFTSDTEGLYTKEQSSENISEWLISTSRGYLDKDKNRKK